MEYDTKKYKIFQDVTRIQEEVEKTLDTLYLCYMSFLVL